MKLFHHPMSSCSRRVNLTLAILGRTVEEQRLIDLASPADRAALREVNPNEKVPVLVDGDFVLWESHAIMAYLCDQTPGQTLYPTDLRGRADVQRWLHWVGAHLGSSVGPINFEKLWKKFMPGGGEPDAAVVARHEALFRQAAAVIDAHLARRTWLVGDRVTLADLSVATTLMYAPMTQLPLEPYPHLRALLGRVHELPAWAATEWKR